jgi:hypothetical protein
MNIFWSINFLHSFNSMYLRIYFMQLYDRSLTMTEVSQVLVFPAIYIYKRARAHVVM